MKKLLLPVLLFPTLFFSQLINGGMENYVFTTNDTLPDGWVTESNISTYIGRSTNAHSGNYAFVINTWYHYSPGMMVNGNPPSNLLLTEWPRAGTPISTKPSTLNGYYMYTDTVNGDSAVVQVLLKKWNGAQGKIDTVAYGIKKLPAANAWTSFSVQMTDFMPGVSPDSVVVFFMTFDYNSSPPICPNPWCRYLHIDDLSLSGVLGAKEHENETEGFNFIYSDNTLFFSNESNEQRHVSVFSADGRLLKRLEVSAGSSQLDVNDLPAGMYFATVSGEYKSGFKFVKASR